MFWNDAPGDEDTRKASCLLSRWTTHTMCPDDTVTAGSWAGIGLVNWYLDLLQLAVLVGQIVCHWLDEESTTLMLSKCFVDTFFFCFFSRRVTCRASRKWRRIHSSRDLSSGLFRSLITPHFGHINDNLTTTDIGIPTVTKTIIQLRQKKLRKNYPLHCNVVVFAHDVVVVFFWCCSKDQFWLDTIHQGLGEEDNSLALLKVNHKTWYLDYDFPGWQNTRYVVYRQLL
jgi:hypothetical protein